MRFQGLLPLLLIVLLGGLFSGLSTPNPPIPETGRAPEQVELDGSVRQGEVLTIRVKNPRSGLDQATAWLTGVRAPLFKQPDGSLEGVMPVKVEQSPGTYPIKIQNREGETIFTEQVTITNAGYSRQNIRVTKSMGGTRAEPGELETVASLKKETGSQRYWQPPFVLPTPDCVNSPFGNLRYHNGKFTGQYHKGIDLRSPRNRPIKATADGKVKIARFFRLHGGTVGLDHGQGISSIYIHMNKINVEPGQQVKKGQVIGQVGATGFATGPHLHWGLFVNGYPVNPMQWVQARYCG